VNTPTLDRLKPELHALLERMIDHLATQRSRSTSRPAGGACVYRSLDGKMCAVGCLIPDALYDSSIEGPVSELLGAEDGSQYQVAAHLRSLAPSTSGTALEKFLQLVQAYHDTTPDTGGTPLGLTLAHERNYHAALQGPADMLRERIVADLEALIDSHTRRTPAAKEWFV
jgi:hypothetical protein